MIKHPRSAREILEYAKKFRTWLWRGLDFDSADLPCEVHTLIANARTDLPAVVEVAVELRRAVYDLLHRGFLPSPAVSDAHKALADSAWLGNVESEEPQIDRCIICGTLAMPVSGGNTLYCGDCLVGPFCLSGCIGDHKCEEDGDG